MKRYDVTTEYNNGVMEEDPDGDYVKVVDLTPMLVILSNILYWDTCPMDYKQAISNFTGEEIPKDESS